MKSVGGATGPPIQDLVSVLIPARNEEATIASAVGSVRAQDHENLEILVVDGVSEDGTRKIVEQIASEDPRVRLLNNSSRTIPSALNVGLGAATGRWLVRVDAHSTVPPEYVSHAVAQLRGGPWGGVGGRKDAVGSTAAGRAIAAVLGSPFGVGGSVYHHGNSKRTVDHIPFGAYRTELLRELGGWDEQLHANEDFELDHRLREAGHELLFDPELRIAWVCRQRVPDVFKQYRRYGRGKALVSLLHPESLKPRHLAPPAFVALTAAASVLRRRRLLSALMTTYGLFVAVASTSVARSLDDRVARRWLPLVFPALHLGYGIGFWEVMLQRVTEGSPSVRDASA